MGSDGFGGCGTVSQPLSLAFHLYQQVGIITHNVGGHREDDNMFGVDQTQRLPKCKRANGSLPPEQNQPRSLHESFCTERESAIRPGSAGRRA